MHSMHGMFAMSRSGDAATSSAVQGTKPRSSAITARALHC